MTPQQIKELRTRMGLTQESFADFLGVSYVTINRWENGVAKPSALAVKRISSLIKKEKIA